MDYIKVFNLAREAFLGNYSNSEDLDNLLKKTTTTVRALLAEGKNQEAKLIVLRGLKIFPDHPRMLELLGVANDGLGVHDEAIAIFERLHKDEPDNPDHLNNISICYASKKDYGKAVEYAKKVVEMSPNPVFLNNLGIQYRNYGTPAEAIRTFRKALDAKPDPSFMVNLSTVYGDLMNLPHAIEWCETAIALNPKLSGAHVNLSYFYHLAGRHKEAWREYEYRLQYFPQMKDYVDKFGPNKWNGKDSLEGKRVLVYCEQGFGDAINFIRYIPLLKKRGCHVMVYCGIPLVTLLEECDGVDEVICKGVNFNCEYDYHLPLLSLPYLLGHYDIPSAPYIQCQPADKKFPVYPRDRFKIGICWRGSSSHPNDRNRSIEANKFFEISQLPGISLVCLQKDAKIAEIHPLRCNLSLRDVNDFRETAEIIAHLDLVISVDTAVLHLAGAMGKETWALLPYKPDWRWGLQDTTEWYPTMKLYRQQRINGWEEVFFRVCRDLKLKLQIA